MKTKLLVTVFAVLFVVILICPQHSSAGLNAYATIMGQRQGWIQGDVTQKGREGQIEVNGFGHSIIVPTDPATGMATGKISHRPVKIVKPIDKSTPKLSGAMATNENLTSVIIRFWKPGLTGSEVQYYTVTLTNAHIVSVAPSTSDDSTMLDQEIVSFVYQSIKLTYTDGGIETIIDWAQLPY